MGELVEHLARLVRLGVGDVVRGRDGLLAAGAAVFVDDGIAGDPGDPVREPFAVIDRAEVAVDPQQDVADEVLGPVRVGDAAPDERAELRDHVPPGLFGDVDGRRRAGRVHGPPPLPSAHGGAPAVIDDGSAARTQSGGSGCATSAAIRRDLVLDGGAVDMGVWTDEDRIAEACRVAQSAAIRVFSITTTSAPRRISPSSAISTAPCRIRARSPRTTAQTVAEGAI